MMILTNNIKYIILVRDLLNYKIKSIMRELEE